MYDVEIKEEIHDLVILSISFRFPIVILCEFLFHCSLRLRVLCASDIKEHEAKNQQVVKEFRWSNRNIFAILWNKIPSTSLRFAGYCRVWAEEMTEKKRNTFQVLSYQFQFLLFTRNEISARDKGTERKCVPGSFGIKTGSKA